jgi:hypothetical protein
MRESNKIFTQGGLSQEPSGDLSGHVRNVAKDDFGWEIPVELVPVPSEGLVYSKESGMHRTKALEIKSMTAREEDILTSRAFIKKGTVVDELIKSCLIDKNVDVNSLLKGDRDALMVSIRITGYGTSYEASVNCPNCGTRHKDKEFDLSNLEIKRLELNPISEGVNEFEFELPVSKKRVTFKFLTIRDDQMLSIEKERKRALFGEDYIEGSVTDSLLSHIVSIDGIRDRSKISMFINKMPALDSSKLRKYIAENKPGISMKVPLACHNCNTTNSIDLPIGISFFWPAL